MFDVKACWRQERRERGRVIYCDLFFPGVELKLGGDRLVTYRAAYSEGSACLLLDVVVQGIDSLASNVDVPGLAEFMPVVDHMLHGSFRAMSTVLGLRGSPTVDKKSANWLITGKEQ